jgi:DNA-binding NtrC family response regulator
MPMATQAKLLRVLEDRKLRRLGSKAETPVDVRVIAATNKDPQQAVQSGQLRGDLFYRLNVFNIQMPPLRDLSPDIPAIAAKMVDDMNQRHGCTVSGIAPDLLKRLLAYDWPGNARELRNTIERATILAGSGLIGIEHLPPSFGEPGYATRLAPTPEAAAVPSPARYDDRAIRVEVGTTVDEAERQLILKTLLSTHNNKTRAAEILGITPKTLQNKLKEYSSAAASSDAATPAIDVPAVAAE